MTVDLGLGWNALELEIVPLAPVAERVDPPAPLLKSLAKGLTAAQKRELACVELKEAVATQNAALLSDVFAAHPKIAFPRYLREDFLEDALVHFHPQIITELEQRGFVWNPMNFYTVLYTHSNVRPVMDFLFDHTERVYDAEHQSKGYPYIWHNFVSNLFLQARANSSFGGKHLALDQMIEQRYPQLWNELSASIGDQNNLFHAALIGNVNLQPYLSRINWPYVFDLLPDRLADGCTPLFLRELSVFLSTHPDLAQIWNTQQAKRMETSTEVERLAQEWMGTTYDSSRLKGVLETWIPHDAPRAFCSRNLSSMHADFVWRASHTLWKDFCSGVFSAYQNSHSKITFSPIQEQSVQLREAMNVVKNCWRAPSLLHAIVAQGLPVVVDIAQTPDGARIVTNAFAHPVVRHSFALHVSLDTLRALHKLLPQITQDVDNEGNTLSHLFASRGNLSSLNQNELGQFARINPEAFFAENAAGQSVKKMLEKTWHSSYLNNIEAMLMKKMIKTNPDVSRKLHRGGPKRRM